MAFLFYIDGQLIDQPINDTDLSSSIKRDRRLNNLLVTQDVELELNANNDLPVGTISGYAYLKNLFDSGACNEAEIKIYDVFSNTDTRLFYVGTIKIPSIKFEYHTQTLKTKIQDNSFYSYINNNKNLEVNLSAIVTKSDFLLTQISKYSLNLFNHNTCVYGSTTGAYYEAYLVYDVFDLIVRAISDNKISFYSQFLIDLNEKPFLCKGQDLLNPYTIYPNAQEPVIKLTFEKLFDEMRKLYNVFFWIDTTDLNNPILRLETYDTSFNDGIAYSFNDIKELNVSIDAQSIYSKVLVGSNKVTSGSFDNSISYYGWVKEEFFPLGQCNIDNELNLVNSFIIDTNSIHDTIIGTSTNLIDEIFIIECNGVDYINKTASAVQYPQAGGNCWYNIGINNFNKVQRYSNQFLTTFGNFNGLGGYGFHASLGTNPISFSNNPSYGNPIGLTNYICCGTGANNPPPIWYNYPLVIFPDETSTGNFDDGGNYNNTNGRYTLPVDGTYNFLFETTYNVVNCNNGGFTLDSYYFRLKLKLGLYDSANNLITQNEFIIPYKRFNGLYTDTATFVVTGVAGDYAICSLDVAIFYNTLTLFPNNIPILNINEATYSTIVTPSYVGGGGGSGNNNANKYLYDFDYEIPQEDYINLLTNVTRKIEFEKDGVTRIGWIDSMKRNDWNGLTQIKIITSKYASFT
jgi:hypothetical protein